MASIISVLSANGGMGKSLFSSNVSYGLKTSGACVLLVEAGFGNRADDIILGIESDSIYTFSDICSKKCKSHEAIVRADKSYIPDFISAGPAVNGADPAEGISNIVNSQSSNYDYIILDLSSAFDSVFDNAVKISDIAIVITDDSSISVRNTALAVTKLREIGCKKIYIVLNKVIVNGDMSAVAVEDIADETGEMILGIIPNDEYVRTSVEKSDPIYKYNTYAGRSLENICKRIMGMNVPEYETGVSGILFSKNKFTLK